MRRNNEATKSLLIHNDLTFPLRLPMSLRDHFKESSLAPCKQLRFSLILFSIFAPPLLAWGSEIVKTGKFPEVFYITQSADRPWQNGDRVCAYRFNKKMGCGMVTARNEKLAAVKIKALYATNPVAVGDLIAAATGQDSRSAASASEIEGSVRASGSSYSKVQLSGELLGASLVYSLFGSYRITRSLCLNAGFSYLALSTSSGPLGATTTSGSAIQIPVSVSLLLLGEKTSFLETLAGVDLLFGGGGNSGIIGVGSSSGSASVIIPEAGIGYRYWPQDGGFHFRATAYLLLAPAVSSSSTTTTVASSSGLKPWFGLSLGYAF